MLNNELLGSCSCYFQVESLLQLEIKVLLFTEIKPYEIGIFIHSKCENLHTLLNNYICTNFTPDQFDLFWHWQWKIQTQSHCYILRR